MHIDYAHHKTGYLLANPSHFSDIGYERDIAHLNFSQLKALKGTVQFLKNSKLYAKQLHGTQETELTQLVRQQCCKCDWRDASAADTDQIDQIMPKKSLVKTVEAVARTLGIPNIDCAVVATAMAFFAFQKDALDFKKYETSARSTLNRMKWVIEKREIASQSCSRFTSIFHQQGFFQKKLDDPVHRERATIWLKIDQPLTTANSDLEFDDLEWEKIEQQIKLANL